MAGRPRCGRPPRRALALTVIAVITVIIVIVNVVVVVVVVVVLVVVLVAVPSTGIVYQLQLSNNTKIGRDGAWS